MDPAEQASLGIVQSAQERRSLLTVLKIANVGGIVHLVMLLQFALLGPPQLAWFNLGSVATFAVARLLASRGYRLPALLPMQCEVLLHQVYAVHLLGWDAGFQDWLLCLTLSFLLFTRRQRAFAIATLVVASWTYVALYLRYFGQPPRYPLPGAMVKTLGLGNRLGTGLFVTGMAVYYGLAADRAENALQLAHHRVEELLHNILPPAVVAWLSDHPSQSHATRTAEATVLFADLVGFTRWSEEHSPEELVRTLDALFTQMDALVEKHGLEKIKTIGDAYMVAAGVPNPRPDHVEVMARLALDFQRLLVGRADGFQMRIGLHTGPVVAGVIGRKKFAYDLWGDTVNTAARMESHGLPGEIQVSQAVQSRLPPSFQLRERGLIQIKGKGPLPTWLLTGESVE